MKKSLEFLCENSLLPFTLFFSSFLLGSLAYYYANRKDLKGRERAKDSLLFGLKAGACACVWSLPIALSRRLGRFISQEEERREEERE